MTNILAFVIALLIAAPALAQSCVVLSPDNTTIVAGPMPMSAKNDCSQYAGNVAIVTPSDPRWTAWLAAQSAQQAARSYQTTLQQKLVAGIAISCTCSGYAYGSLNGTYSLTADFLNTLTGLTIRAVGNRPLSGSHGPQGGAVVPLYDTAGVSHSWDQAHILELADTVTDYQVSMSLQNVQANGWPTSNAFTIQ